MNEPGAEIMMQRAQRVGLMVPINNTTMEPELLAWLPPGSRCETRRIPRGKGTLTPQDLPQYVAQAMTLAEQFANDSVDLVIYGCTAAGFMMGPVRDAEIGAELRRITGKPVVTTAGAMIESLRDIGAQTIALVTPYSDMVNERLRKFVEGSGIAVGVFASFRARTVDELAAITPEQIATLARTAMPASCDAMFIACSQLPTFGILEDLERDFGRPVRSSIRATAWQAMRESAAFSAGG
jgi:maleate cis-trans isomerase